MTQETKHPILIRCAKKEQSTIWSVIKIAKCVISQYIDNAHHNRARKYNSDWNNRFYVYDLLFGLQSLRDSENSEMQS